MDLELLSRLQFAGTIMFHYLFPPLTIGLGLIMVLVEAQWLRTGDASWKHAAKFWTKIFALNFALGVASGIVMEFQFGTNWAAYSRFVGDVFGSALAAEGIFAFFLESGFLAVLVFGWDRVGKKMHFTATLLVFLGSCFSAVWIVVANSWQQTPAGYHIVENLTPIGDVAYRAEITDFWAMVFNPSSVDRLTHTLIGAMILGAFFVLSVSSWYILKKQHDLFARRSFSIALPVAAFFSLLALVTGHDQAKQVVETQPAKMAAYEGHFETGPGDLYLIGWPDADAGKTYGIAIPGMLSWLISGDATTEVTGLNDIPEDEQPPVWLPFQSYHLMISLGMFFIVLTLASLPLMKGGRIYQMRWLLWIYVFSILGAFAANHLGWIAAEVGRQPWIVYPSVQDGVTMQGLRTSDGLSESVRAEQVLWSIIMFGLIYGMLFVVWLVVLNKKIQAGPEEHASIRGADEHAGGGFFKTSAERVWHTQTMTDAKADPEQFEHRPIEEGGKA
jgi:cytochrome bd ubiquinol oxidase subunit I